MTGFEAPNRAEIQALDHIAAHRWAETRNLDPDALSWLVSRGLVEVHELDRDAPPQPVPPA